ncbi:MAG: hypothetical protein KDB27_33505, partial [Planctomycetales bacterium]|nr:hypothetical protein [Planctomycetales bacterium]
FPEMIAEWYRTHDYNFLALSDHNTLSQGQRWMKLNAVTERSKDKALQKYLERFGEHWVETRGEGEVQEVRLKPLDEFRSLLEERGKFILIQGEEISDKVGDKPVHMNATNVNEEFQPLGGATVPEAIDANLRAVKDQAERAGREVIVHLNHPNFHYGVTAEELAAVLSERYFEVYNGHPGINHLGDDEHVTVEKLWDIANTIRVANLNGPLLMGVATDDSHNYHDDRDSTPGRGWIMVRARHLTPESLVRAMEKGDFYASRCVVLDKIENTDSGISISIAPQDGVEFQTEFIGTRRAAADSEIAKENIGEVFATIDGVAPQYTFSGDELYVRAVIHSSRPHPNPSFEGQVEEAWTQPVQPHAAKTD